MHGHGSAGHQPHLEQPPDDGTRPGHARDNSGGTNGDAG
jgi:hypothetical protein